MLTQIKNITFNNSFVKLQNQKTNKFENVKSETIHPKMPFSGLFYQKYFAPNTTQLSFGVNYKPSYKTPIHAYHDAGKAKKNLERNFNCIFERFDNAICHMDSCIYSYLNAVDDAIDAVSNGKYAKTDLNIRNITKDSLEFVNEAFDLLLENPKHPEKLGMMKIQFGELSQKFKSEIPKTFEKDFSNELLELFAGVEGKYKAYSNKDYKIPGQIHNESNWKNFEFKNGSKFKFDIDEQEEKETYERMFAEEFKRQSKNGEYKYWQNGGFGQEHNSGQSEDDFFGRKYNYKNYEKNWQKDSFSGSYFKEPPKNSDYVTLGLEPGASKETIKKAYRKLAIGCHPDTHPDDPSATAKFRSLNEAYERLMQK